MSFHLFLFPLGLPRLILFLVRNFYLALTLNVSFLSYTLWFLVSLQENSSPESCIYKVLQGSPLSLLLASSTFPLCSLPVSQRFPPPLSTCLSVVSNISGSQQSSVLPSWDSPVLRTCKGNTMGTAGHLLCTHPLCPQHNFAFQNHVWATTNGVCRPCSPPTFSPAEL